MPANKELSVPQKRIYLAEHIMGWKLVGTDEEKFNGFYAPDGKSPRKWNPLESWDDWRAVEERVMEDEELSVRYVRKVSIERSETMWDAVWKADLPTRVSALISAHQELYGK